MNDSKQLSRKNSGLAPERSQSLLRYHRPLIEDGDIEYEFYYVPGETHVHPVLDRLTLLIEPAGIRIHWLTDAQYDRSGLACDNAIDDPVGRRGPGRIALNERDWNRVKLKLTGDRLSLAINGVAAFERQIEPSNQRTFGLFHYADETDVRVRNIVFRGDWPRTLPDVTQQELAAAAPQ